MTSPLWRRLAAEFVCCCALQDKVWVHGPGNEPWEVYVVKGDADNLAKADTSVCCGDPAENAEPVGVSTGSNCC